MGLVRFEGRSRRSATICRALTLRRGLSQYRQYGRALTDRAVRSRWRWFAYQRKAAEQSRADADAAYNLRMNAAGGANLPPELSLRLKEIEMKREVCARANCTFWFGETPAVVASAK